MLLKLPSGSRVQSWSIKSIIIARDMIEGEDCYLVFVYLKEGGSFKIPFTSREEAEVWVDSFSDLANFSYRQEGRPL